MENETKVEDLEKALTEKRVSMEHLLQDKADREFLKKTIREKMSVEHLEEFKNATREELRDELNQNDEDILNDLKDEIVVEKKLSLFDDLLDDIYEYLGEQN